MNILKFFLSSISPKIDGSVKKMGRLLQEVRGGGQGQAISKSEVAAAADGILGPLMDLLDGEIERLRVSDVIDKPPPQDLCQCTLKTVIRPC